MSRGGSRPGAGRKAAPEKRVQITVTVAPETKATLAKMRAAGQYIGRIIDDIAKKWTD